MSNDPLAAVASVSNSGSGASGVVAKAPMAPIVVRTVSPVEVRETERVSAVSSVSPLAKLLSQLHAIAQKDGAEAAASVEKFASQIRRTAQVGVGTNQYADLMRQLKHAAQTGDLSSIRSIVGARPNAQDTMRQLEAKAQPLGLVEALPTVRAALRGAEASAKQSLIARGAKATFAPKR